VCESACEYRPRPPEESVLYGVVADLGASTPKYLVILNLSGDTSAASRSVTPATLEFVAKPAVWQERSPSFDSGGRAAYLNNRSNRILSRKGTLTSA